MMLLSSSWLDSVNVKSVLWPDCVIVGVWLRYLPVLGLYPGFVVCSFPISV